MLQSVLRLCKGKGKGKGKAIPLQAWTSPDGSRRFRLPDFTIIAIGKLYNFVSLTGRLYHMKYSWYSFLLEAESAAGPYCGWKDYV
jgi:hypothetical protein